MKNLKAMYDAATMAVREFCIDAIIKYMDGAERTENGAKWATFDYHGEDKCITDEDFYHYYKEEDIYHDRIHKAENDIFEFFCQSGEFDDDFTFDTLCFDSEFFSVNIEYGDYKILITIKNENE